MYSSHLFDKHFNVLLNLWHPLPHYRKNLWDGCLWTVKKMIHVYYNIEITQWKLWMKIWFLFTVVCFEHTSYKDDLIVQGIGVFKLVVSLDKFDRETDNSDCQILFWEKSKLLPGIYTN